MSRVVNLAFRLFNRQLRIGAPAAIDLILTDVMMPKMGGPELARRVSNIRPELRVVFMSGYSEDPVVRSIERSASLFLAKPFTSYTSEDYALVKGVNLDGFFNITQLAIAEMEKRQSGHIVTVTTTLTDHAISGVPSVLASLTKGGLNAATKSIAIEYAKAGIRANAVSPGVIKSPMHPVDTHAALGSLHPMGHMGEMDDIVQAVLYLDSAPFVTGEILHVDGGQSAGH